MSILPPQYSVTRQDGEILLLPHTPITQIILKRDTGQSYIDGEATPSPIEGIGVVVVNGYCTLILSTEIADKVIGEQQHGVL